MDRATDLAVHGPGLAVDHENGFVGRGDQVSAEHPRARDGAVRVAPFRSTRIHGTPDTRDHLYFAVRQVDEQDVFLGRRTGV